MKINTNKEALILNDKGEQLFFRRKKAPLFVLSVALDVIWN